MYVREREKERGAGREREREREREKGERGILIILYPADSNTSSSLATPSVSVRKGTSGTVIAVVKKDPSPSMTSLSLGNLLSSSNMSGPSVVAVKVKEEKKEMVKIHSLMHL